MDERLRMTGGRRAMANGNGGDLALRRAAGPCVSTVRHTCAPSVIAAATTLR